MPLPHFLKNVSFIAFIQKNGVILAYFKKNSLKNTPCTRIKKG